MSDKEYEADVEEDNDYDKPKSTGLLCRSSSPWSSTSSGTGEDQSCSKLQGLSRGLSKYKSQFVKNFIGGWSFKIYEFSFL